LLYLFVLFTKIKKSAFFPFSAPMKSLHFAQY
jgi:hypothetical protein